MPKSSFSGRNCDNRYNSVDDEDDTGEIKSTMDLVMEKTRHLSLGSDEKAALAKTELRRRIAGLVQRYLDDTIRETAFEEAYRKLERETEKAAGPLLLTELISRLDPEQEQTRLLSLLAANFGDKVDKFKEILENSRADLAAAADEHRAKLTEDLAKRFSLEGSAVRPNLRKGNSWRDIRRQQKRNCQEQLTQLTRQMAATRS